LHKARPGFESERLFLVPAITASHKSILLTGTQS
jgi:hypothetical protein